MGQVKRQGRPRVFEVVVSFDGLDKGEVFTQQPDDLGWALTHVASGYLRDITPEEEAQNAGEVGKG